MDFVFIGGSMGAVVGEKIARGIDYSIKNKQIKMIHLEVRSDNLRAIKVYKNMGFENVGTIKKAVKIEDKYYSNLLMIREVS